MSDYEFECSRAELLGLPRPSRDEFMARKPVALVEEAGEGQAEDDVTTEQVENIDLQGEGIDRTTGGLDELNNILSITQKKINRFKTVCGSFTNLLKLKVSGRPGEEGDACSVNSMDAAPSCNPENGTPYEADNSKVAGARTSGNKDINTQLGCQIDKLDSMFMKAEQAELSLHSQNKQMRQFLNK